MKNYGIDVSRHQGTINTFKWNEIKNKAKFVIIRAGYGNSVSQKDSQFESNYASAKVYGIPVGAYWYSYASSPEDAQREAQACLRVIDGKKFEYPIWYDIEYEPSILSQSKVSRTACCKAFCNELEKAGYYTGVYCSRDFITSKLNYSELAGYDLWVAAYTGADTPGAVPIAYGMWQYSSKNALRIEGFAGSLDCNIAYKDYPTIIKNVGLNGYGKPEDIEEPVSVWETNGPWRIEGATGGDKIALKEVCEKYGLKVTKI